MATMNRILTAAFDAVFGVMETWPGWISLLLWSSVAGVLALVAFKYTSNQRAIGKVRDDIKTHLLAAKLYKDDVGVTLRSQGGLFWAAARLLFHSLPPFAVMLVPMLLLVVQMSLRYEWRPVRPGSEVLVVAELKADTPEETKVLLELPDGLRIQRGPTREYRAGQPKQGLDPRNAVVWCLVAEQPGNHRITLQSGGQRAEKELVVTEAAYARVNPIRPGGSFWDRLLFPAESPAAKDDLFQRIEIDDYPPGSTPILGWDLHWIITFVLASMVVALLAKPFLNVKL